MLTERAHKRYSEKETIFDETIGTDTFREVERMVLLRNVDSKWMDHIDAMSDLMDSIGLQAYGQRNPITEYKIEGSQMFDEMVDAIRTDTVMQLLNVMPRREIKRTQVLKVTGESHGDDSEPVKKKPAKAAAGKVGRNDPCPCGSGKKYKKCCGAGNKDSE
ncbi:Protein translocase subunit SecA [bioreactor metagenome]|uniref:Protein translocase subunit SecA n=1 Tax=bioreactor metagenome TaxID=1076179 RepID=A0A645A4D6_9ZZZZ